MRKVHVGAARIDPREVARNTKAYIQCLELLKEGGETIRRVVDIRYGLGSLAREVLQRFPQAKLLGFECDKETYDKAWTCKSVTLHHSPFTADLVPTRFHQPDLMTADFNSQTVLNRGEIDHAIISVKPQIVAFTDTAYYMLHRNYRSYGLSGRDLEAYWDRFLIDGYTLVKWYQPTSKSSVAMFRGK